MTNPTQSEVIARRWANKISDRLAQIGIPEAEINETRVIVFTFAKIAWDSFQTDPSTRLPHLSEPYQLTLAEQEEALDLFLRAVNQSAKKLRSWEPNWSKRKDVMEKMAGQLLNMSKLLLAYRSHNDPKVKLPVKTSKDVQFLMKQATDKLLEQACGLKPVANIIPWRK